MATIVLYKMNERISFDNNTLLTYQQVSQRDVFFRNITIQETISSDLTPSFVKKLWDLETTLTIYLEGRNPLSEYNYISIEVNSFIHYYFIMGYDDLGSNQVRYFLRKDTLNTYASRAFWGVDIEKSNALITREHKDRFILGGDIVLPDQTIEGLNVQIKNIEEKETVGGSDRTRLSLRRFGGDFYHFENENFDETFLKSAPKLMWKVNENNKRIIRTSNEFSLKFGWGVVIGSTSVSVNFTDPNNNSNYIRIRGLGTPVALAFIEGNIIAINIDTGSRYLIPSSNIMATSGVFTNNNSKLIPNELETLIVSVDELVTANVYYDLGNTQSSTFEYPSRYFKRFGVMDSNVQIGELMEEVPNYNMQKTIELPYKILNVGSVFKGATNGVYIDVGSLINLINVQPVFKVPTFDLTGTLLKLKVPLNDPKIYNKEFQPRFLTIYNESFVFGIDNFKYIHDDISQNLIVSSTLNVADYSKLKIEISSTSGNMYERTLKEYVKVIDMNNEVTSFSTDFDKYIQTTLENDIKLMRLQESQAQRQLSKQRSSLLTNIGVGAVSGALVGNFAGAGIGAIGGFIKGANDIRFALDQAAEDSEKRRIDFENKILNLQNGLINIAGSSPEQNHSDNSDKFKWFNTVLIDNDLNYLDQYFHKFGYKTMEYKKPTLRTRQYFNYLEAEFEELKSSINLTREVKEDIINRFKQGVTAFHYQVNTTWRFDFEQKYENWELT